MTSLNSMPSSSFIVQTHFLAISILDLPSKSSDFAMSQLQSSLSPMILSILSHVYYISFFTIKALFQHDGRSFTSFIIFSRSFDQSISTFFCYLPVTFVFYLGQKLHVCIYNVLPLGKYVYYIILKHIIYAFAPQFYVRHILTPIRLKNEGTPVNETISKRERSGCSFLTLIPYKAPAIPKGIIIFRMSPVIKSLLSHE